MALLGGSGSRSLTTLHVRYGLVLQSSPDSSGERSASRLTCMSFIHLKAQLGLEDTLLSWLMWLL